MRPIGVGHGVADPDRGAVDPEMLRLQLHDETIRCRKERRPPRRTPNPYRLNAAWDGLAEGDRKLYFYNLPAKSEVRIYTISGDIIAEFEHDANDYNGDIDWFQNYSDDPRVMAGGEHAWDLQSSANQILTTGLYLYSVKDIASGEVQTGKIVIIK